MNIPIFQVDAFADSLFSGNPAAVCLLNHWYSDVVLQNIAAENNLSETAFLVKDGEIWELRWFTPVTEVDLCGHATLASAHVLFHHLRHPGNKVFFRTRSGMLNAEKQGKMILLDFPVDTPIPVPLPEEIPEALGKKPLECFKGKSDYMLVFGQEDEVKYLNPNFEALKKTDARGIIVTAPGERCDFVSRFFGPQVGINEDPVTGSAHTILTPYWSKRFGKLQLTAKQISSRGGSLLCTLSGERVLIGGMAVIFLEGILYLPDTI